MHDPLRESANFYAADTIMSMPSPSFWFSRSVAGVDVVESFPTLDDLLCFLTLAHVAAYVLEEYPNGTVIAQEVEPVPDLDPGVYPLPLAHETH